ncbi:hypothetical protein ACSBR2_011869 [Camellia fascicularis]
MSEAPPLNSKQDNDSMFKSIVDWIVICMGYASGIVIRTVIYWAHIDHKTFGRKQQKRRKEKSRGQGNSSRLGDISR